MRRPMWRVAAVCVAGLLLAGCNYARLLRPSVLKQLNPDVVRLLNELPNVDEPNKAVIARLFAHGGLSHAERGSDGVMRDTIRVPENQFIWQPGHHRHGAWLGGELVDRLSVGVDDGAHVDAPSSLSRRHVRG